MTLPDFNDTEVREFDTALCSTCGEPSSFIDDRPGANPVGYCAPHVPEALQVLAASGQLTVATGNDQSYELPAERNVELAIDEGADKVEKASRRR